MPENGETGDFSDSGGMCLFRGSGNVPISEKYRMFRVRNICSIKYFFIKSGIILVRGTININYEYVGVVNYQIKITLPVSSVTISVILHAVLLFKGIPVPPSVELRAENQALPPH